MEGLTLQAARADYFEAAESTEGGTCPCCDRHGKVNANYLRSGITRGAIWLYNWHCDESFSRFCHLPTQAPRYVLTSNNMGKLRHWGVVEREVVETDDGHKHEKSGRYRLTSYGRAFIQGTVRAPECIFTYNDEVWGKGDDLVTVRQALGKSFNYDEIIHASLRGAA